MKIHLTGAFEYMDVNVGFGNAADQIYRHFKEHGLQMTVSRPDDHTPFDADIEICFDQPQRYKFVCPRAYRIGYTPWESTELMPSWPRMISSCDEIWTPNEFGRSVFQHHFPDKPVFVFQHGVDAHYRPRKRKIRKEKPFTFLFMGEPQWRKDGQLVADTFINLYADNPDYRLILKATKICNITVKDPTGRITGSPDSFYENIITMRKILSPKQLISLYDEADAFVYPTWGEGWGFNPMQAMAMGIPTISTYAWSDYAEYITLPIESYQQPSPWPDLHPGMMFRPDPKQLEQAMQKVSMEYEHFASIAFKNSFKIHNEFNWNKVCNPAVDRLQKIFSSLELKV